jgi:hypothetical protein
LVQKGGYFFLLAGLGLQADKQTQGKHGKSPCGGPFLGRPGASVGFAASFFL